MSVWTAFGMRCDVTGDLNVVAVVPGDVTKGAEFGRGADYLTPSCFTVQADSAQEAITAAQRDE